MKYKPVLEAEADIGACATAACVAGNIRSGELSSDGF